MAGPLAGHREAVKLARQPGREIGDVDHLLDFAQALGENLSGFERDQSAQFVLGSPQFLADFANDLAALGSGKHAPTLEGLRRLPDGFVVVFFGGQRDAAQFSARARDCRK